MVGLGVIVWVKTSLTVVNSSIINDQVIDIFPCIVPVESLLFKYAQVHICYFSAS